MDRFFMNQAGPNSVGGVGQGFPQGMGMPVMGQDAFNRLGGPGFAGNASPMGDMFSSTMRQNQMLLQMLEILTMFLLTSQLSQAMGLPGANGAGGVPGISSTAGGGGGVGGVDAAGGGGGGGGSAAPAGSPGSVSQTDAPAPSSNGQAASPVNIGPGTKVLEIGDSHTVGTFGQELDSKLRSTGANVATYASAGASPSWFVNGTPTKYGYSERHADGSVSTTPYGQSHATPKLEELIAKEKPAVIVVNLGANFRGAGPGGIKSQVASIGEVAKRHNIPIVWVGPPKMAKDMNDPGSIQKFDQEMAAAVAPYGKYVASSPFTPEYAGSDGLHYGGAKGTQIAKKWADGVFNSITGR